MAQQIQLRSYPMSFASSFSHNQIYTHQTRRQAASLAIDLPYRSSNNAPLPRHQPRHLLPMQAASVGPKGMHVCEYKLARYPTQRPNALFPPKPSITNPLASHQTVLHSPELA